MLKYAFTHILSLHILPGLLKMSNMKDIRPQVRQNAAQVFEVCNRNTMNDALSAPLSHNIETQQANRRF